MPSSGLFPKCVEGTINQIGGIQVIWCLGLSSENNKLIVMSSFKARVLPQKILSKNIQTEIILCTLCCCVPCKMSRYLNSYAKCRGFRSDWTKKHYLSHLSQSYCSAAVYWDSVGIICLPVFYFNSNRRVTVDWTRWPLKIPSNSNSTMILSFSP